MGVDCRDWEATDRVGAGEKVGAGVRVTPPTPPPLGVGTVVRLVKGVKLGLPETEAEGVAWSEVEGDEDEEWLGDWVALGVVDGATGVKVVPWVKPMLPVLLTLELCERLPVGL